MQPWENEKKIKGSPKRKERRSIREKLNLVTNAIALSTIACTFIYGSVMYECFKEIVYMVDPKLKK